MGLSMLKVCKLCSLAGPMIEIVGVRLRGEEKRLHLTDIGREHLIDNVVQEVLPPEG